jgi:mRNA-degrading endonuclease RelE of RelBE toxin-antitoxin system
MLFGRKGHSYRIIYAIEEGNHAVTVLHIRYGARYAFTLDIET